MSKFLSATILASLAVIAMPSHAAGDAAAGATVIGGTDNDTDRTPGPELSPLRLQLLMQSRETKLD